MKKLPLLALLIAPLALSACAYMPSNGKKMDCCKGGECAMHSDKMDGMNK